MAAGKGEPCWACADDCPVWVGTVRGSWWGTDSEVEMSDSPVWLLGGGRHSQPSQGLPVTALLVTWGGRAGERRLQVLGVWAGQNQRRLAARMLPRSKDRGPNSWLCGPGINHTYLLSPLAISNLEIRFPAFKNSPVWGSSLPLLAIFVNKFFMLSQKRRPLRLSSKGQASATLGAVSNTCVAQLTALKRAILFFPPYPNLLFSGPNIPGPPNHSLKVTSIHQAPSNPLNRMPASGPLQCENGLFC